MPRNRHIAKQQKVVSVLSRGDRDITTEEVTIRQMPICWGIPMDELMFSKFFYGFLKNAHIMPWDHIFMTESTYLPDARNEIHNAFLTRSSSPWLMMLDTDILLPHNAVERLLAHNLPLVFGWYPNKNPNYPPHPIVYDYAGKSEKGSDTWTHRRTIGKGLEKVGGVGMGCCLMSRDVAITLGSSPYSTIDGGEDLRLCKKLIDSGVDVMVDWSIACAHMGVRYVTPFGDAGAKNA